MIDKSKVGLEAILVLTCEWKVGVRVVGCPIDLPANFLTNYCEDGSVSEEGDEI